MDTPYREPDPPPPEKPVKRARLNWFILLGSHVKGLLWWPQFMRRYMGGLWALIRGRGEYRWVWVQWGVPATQADYTRFTDLALYHGIQILKYEEWSVTPPRGYIP